MDFFSQKHAIESTIVQWTKPTQFYHKAFESIYIIFSVLTIRKPDCLALSLRTGQLNLCLPGALSYALVFTGAFTSLQSGSEIHFQWFWWFIRLLFASEPLVQVYAKEIKGAESSWKLVPDGRNATVPEHRTWPTQILLWATTAVRHCLHKRLHTSATQTDFHAP